MIRPKHENHVGRVTLPGESGQKQTVLNLLQQWGADAIRDSDGTALPDDLLRLGHEVYSTICLVRAEQTWPREHPEHLPQKFLCSPPKTALNEVLSIPLLKGLHPDKYRIDAGNAETYWEVIDRTSGETVPIESWHYDAERESVHVEHPCPYHVYTASFLVYVIWDTTSMYNHITNNWTGPHIMSTDPYHSEAWDHLMAFYDRWLIEHPQTDVVRLTSLAYHFDVNCDPYCRDTFRDWTGYQETVSKAALEDFAAEYGYHLRAEDFVDQGFYNAAGRVPSQRYRDWMSFVQRFVLRFGKTLTAKAHVAGKRVAVFHGDHWVGFEPFGTNPEEMGIDIHVGAAEDGVALRRVADTPGKIEKEVRLYPYFFPDVFSDGGDPLTESQSNWVKIRRALIRKPVDRIGYGGYLSLAASFPDFCDHVETLCQEFRDIMRKSMGSESSKAPIKVAVINAWGPERSWLNSFGCEQKFFEKRTDVVEVAGSNLLECLSGLPVEVTFLSLETIKKEGVPGDIQVLINDGEANTSWSGGHWWIDEEVVTAIRCFVANGGGLIGCRAPSAYYHEGRFFQLADVLGVEKEIGVGVHNLPPAGTVLTNHPLRNIPFDSDIGPNETFIYPSSPETVVLRAQGKHIQMACNDFGAGRSVFLAHLPYSLANSRVLWQSLTWAARLDSETLPWTCSNELTDCAYYPVAKGAVLINNSPTLQTTELTLPDGKTISFDLPAYSSAWWDEATGKTETLGTKNRKEEEELFPQVDHTREHVRA